MKPATALLVATAIIGAGLLFSAVSLGRLNAAMRRAGAAAATEAKVELDVARLESLRRARPIVGAGSEPEADALALINAAMASAQLPAAHMRSLAAEGAAASPASAAARDAGVVRQSLRLTLGGLSLPELGRFLEAWRTTQSVWSVEQIGLRREAPIRVQRDARWTASLALTATYWTGADTPGGSPR